MFLALGLSQFILFTLVLARVSGLMLIAPVFGAPEVPVQVRALLAVALTLVLMPVQWGTLPSVPQTLPPYLLLIGSELAIGLLLGLAVQIMFSGIQLAGQVIGQVSGLALADVFNPSFDANIPLFSQLLYLTTLAVYLLVGGHRLLVQGLLDTFAAMPAGTAAMPDAAGALTALVTQSFDLGLRAAAPATMALLLATLVMGLISRTLPSLNILAFGFGLNTMVTLGALAFSLGGIAWVFQQQLEPAIDTMLDAVLMGR